MRIEPWFGHYCVMLTCTDYRGERYRHPVSWFNSYQRAQRLLDLFMIDYYRGRLHRLDDIPVIVDYTGMRSQKLPESYNDIVVEGDLSTL